MASLPWPGTNPTTNPTKTILISPSKNKHTRETATLSTSRPATTPTSAPKESSFGGSWVVSVVLMDLCRDCLTIILYDFPFRFHNSWSWKSEEDAPTRCPSARPSAWLLLCVNELCELLWTRFWTAWYHDYYNDEKHLPKAKSVE